MGATARSKTFRHGGSQAVRIPKDLRLPEGEVVVTRHGKGVLVEPATPSGPDVDAMWRAIDALIGPDFMENGREQPPMPPPKAIFDE